MCVVINNSMSLIREMTFLGETYPFWCFCSLGKSEVTGMLLALSPFVGKAKLVKLELKSWGFFLFIWERNVPLTLQVLAKLWQKLQSTDGINCLENSLSLMFPISLYQVNEGRNFLSSNQVAVHWTSCHWCPGVFWLLFLFFSPPHFTFSNYHTCCCWLNKTLLVSLNP